MPLTFRNWYWQFSEACGSVQQYTQTLQWEKMQSNHIWSVNVSLCGFFFFSELKHPPPPPEKKKEIIYVALSVQALIKGFSGKNDSYLKQLEEFFFYCFSIHCVALMKLLNDTREYKIHQRNKHWMTCGRASSSSEKTQINLFLWRKLTSGAVPVAWDS